MGPFGPTPSGGAILHIAMNIDVNWEEEIAAWYAEEHIADLMSAPGFVSGRRFLLSPTRGSKPEELAQDRARQSQNKQLTLYQLEEEGALQSREYMASRYNQTPLTRKVLPNIPYVRSVYRQVFPESGAFEDKTGSRRV